MRTSCSHLLIKNLLYAGYVYFPFPLMSNDQHKPHHTTHRLAAYLTAVQQAYRTLNTVTHHTVGTLFKLLLIAYFIFCALFLALRYLVLPHIDNYKVDVENMATRALGNKVSIATIKASWDGLQPHLSLGDVIIHDKSGDEALRLPKVAATVSWLSMMTGELRLHSLEISRPDMDVTRDAEGNIYVAGIFIDTKKSGNGKGLDWILSQREIIIRDGRLSWTDHKRAAPELVLNGVTLALNNEWREHRFALQATPPSDFAAPVDVRAVFDHPRFTRSISDPSLWKGELYAALSDTDLTVWKAYVDYPIEVQRGKGSVRAWLSFDHAKVADFTADLTLTNVATRLRKDLDPLNLAQVNGRISVQEDFNPRIEDGKPTFGAHGHAIALTDFSLQTEDGLVLPTTTISERFTPARDGQPEKTEIAAKLVDLRTIADFAARLPLPEAQHRALADFAPRGMLKDFSLQWQGTYPNVSAYDIKGHFAALSLNPLAARPARPKAGNTPAQAAVPAIPGFDNLTGSVDANQRGGAFSLASDNLRLQLPGYFADPVMPFDRLEMQAKWTFQDNNRLLLEVSKMDFAQEGLSGSLSGRHLMPLNRAHDKLQGTIDIAGKLNGLNLQRTGNYLPLNTPETLRSWLTGALEGGTADDVRIKLKGDLAQFPFHPNRPGEKPRGEFSVAGKIVNGTLNYAPGKFAKDGKSPLWPLLEEVKGSIVFDRTRMEIKAESARTNGVLLSNTKAIIPDLSKHDMLLGVEGDAAGALQDFVGFANASPVAEWTGHFTEETKGSGNAKLALKLQLPLHQLIESKVQGTLQFINNNVTLQNAIPPMQSANGKLDFNEKGFSLNGIKASFLGGPITVTGGTQRDGGILVKADGSLNVDGIRKTYPSPSTDRVLQRMSGSTRYSASIRVRNKRPEIVVESSLQGLGLDFPVPLRKAAGESLPLKFELNALPSTDASSFRDEIKLTAGSAISARYERQKTIEKGAEWQVVRGGIGVNVPAPQPDSGLIANVSMPSLDIDAWRAAVTAPEPSPSTPAAPLAEAEGKQPATAGISQYIEPEVLAARASELIVMGRKLDNVVVGASHQKGVWQANIDSEQASGYVTWNESRSGRGLGRVTARLASLVIPKSAATGVTELLEGKNTATQMPGLDLIAENFELFGKKFGHLELTANNVRGTAGREWRINKLSIANPDGQLTASGNWSHNEGESISSLTYSLAIADAGKLLDRFGFANVLRGGKGKMEGEVSWKGMPFSLDIPSLSGRVQLDMAAGQFLKVDPAAAKLLGVLSLQSLPRRLALDFRDVFSEGFAFDGVTAAATITQGVAKTDNFKMRGVAATVLIDGTADIAKESQNLHVVVIPEINVGAASVVYGLAVNPVIGVGTFLAQLFLREPLMKAFTFEYEITGPWKDPVVTKLMRKPAAPATGAVARNPLFIG
jgi:uncharacterized protein (TIGR02099 family)